MSERAQFIRWAFAAAAAALLVACAANPQRWTKVQVELPASAEAFPAGVGADIATSQCLICHSAGMVLRQPALTRNEWHAEIVKMRSVYGAPIPEDQVGGLTEYLVGIDGRGSP